MSVAGIAIAAEATNPPVKARQEAMDAIAANMKILGDMAKGETAFDAGAAAAAAAAIAAGADAAPALFEPQETDPKSTAKPDIWTNWEDFTAKAKALGDAARALDAATPESLGAGVGAIGGVCGACHKAYRTS
jgi:cytochrome c556